MASKLEQLASIAGYDTVEDMLAVTALDAVVPGICVNPTCDYTTDVEPDQDAGWCDVCGTQTVKSCLVLAGII